APLAYRARLARKSSATARVQSLAGLWLLQQALTLTGRAAAVLQGIGFSAHDRPRLADGPAFSISHSARFAACAITEAEAGARQVGLDIEEPRPVAPARMARLLGTDEERALVAQQPELFFDYWCAREATVKASGRVGLKRIKQVRIEPGKAWLDGRCWALQPLALAPGLCACLACDVENEPVRSRCLAPTAPS